MSSVLRRILRPFRFSNHWYHDFSRVGLKTTQKNGIYEANQISKELMITSYLLKAMEYVRRDYSKKATVLELFCADGYYAHIAARWGAGRAKGVDIKASNIALAERASKLLGHTHLCEFETGDVHEISQYFDIVLCTGGLYHISDPKGLLAKIRNLFPRYLICQSVVTLTTDDEDYFESPAPGWMHGCRFTSAGMEKMLLETGWEIIEFYENELLGNTRMEDRG